MNETTCSKCGETTHLQHPAQKIGIATRTMVGGVMAYAEEVSTGPTSSD